jgi:hypothetical protein
MLIYEHPHAVPNRGFSVRFRDKSRFPEERASSRKCCPSFSLVLVSHCCRAIRLRGWILPCLVCMSGWPLSKCQHQMSTPWGGHTDLLLLTEITFMSSSDILGGLAWVSLPVDSVGTWQGGRDETFWKSSLIAVGDYFAGPPGTLGQ